MTWKYRSSQGKPQQEVIQAQSMEYLCPMTFPGILPPLTFILT